MRFKLLQNKLSSRLSFKESAFGWDGLSTFIFSNFILILTMGLVFFYLLIQTLRTALFAGKDKISADTVLIAGLRLQDNQPSDEFKQRLDRARALAAAAAKDKLRIIILGGCTGNNQISEARAGADYLQSQGIAASQMVLEEQSRHTLENLQNARPILFAAAAQNAAIISSRYHLYRLVTLSRGLQMNLLPVAAEERFSLSVHNLLRLLKEVYYLHWYWSGKLWVFITANKKKQARIT